ncbi:tetratricopeptide repeat protein [Brachyspira innocens]|uniref:Tetratricopeptide repeat protein n=1 Tax=Brachyspira innocens TaxID=13264 RepID=A0ABT8Z1T0_9SPIR|nr:tetratricopeptide repeat protein [Brachyspira innocens]MDO6992686.1 tetratricopeptide repeat protein [Brachyspira innocens]MDO7021424.1 tetratricopeptide repeat protein [Brachyspira innocens]
MKLKNILLIIFTLYISAYSRDILQYHFVMEDRNINISLDDIKAPTNNIYISNDNIINKELETAEKLAMEGKFFEAIALCNELETNYTNYYKLYYIRGLSYFRRSDLHYAALDFTKLLSLYINTNDTDKVYSLVGNFFDTINEYEQTVITYLTAYKATNNPYWLFLAGNSALKNGDIKSANSCFQSSLKDGQSYGNEGLGDINLLNNRYDDAVNNYKSAKYSNEEDKIRIQSKISNAIVKKELYLWDKQIQAKNYTNALLILNNISSYSANYPEIDVALGKTYFEIKDYQRAKSILSKLILSEKDFDEAYAILAQISLYENNETEAIKILETGLEYCYNKPRLYETFASMLYDIGYTYYPDNIISQIVNFYNISDENKIEYSKSLIRKKRYTEAKNLLSETTTYKNIANELLKNIDYNMILDKAEQLKQKNYYVDMMQLLSMYRFYGTEEQIRIGYIADAYYKLGSIDKAIDILKEGFNANIISVNNVLLLRKLLEIRASNNDTSLYQKERDIIDIKATEYWEEELKLNLNLVTDRIYEFIRFNQFDEALAYISDLRNKNYDVAYIKKIESVTYGLYAAYLYENKQYEDASKTVALAIRRNRSNYDALAVKNEMDVNSYLTSIGSYDNINAYVSLSSTMNEILRIAPAYIENRIRLAESYIREYNIEGFNIINKITEYINVYGGKDLLLGREYNKAYLYSYSMKCYDRASKYLDVNPIYIAETAVHLDNYTSSSIEELLNKNTNSKDALYASSKLYTDIGDYSNAMKYINNAIALDNSNINYIYQKAYINELIGNTREALSNYQNIVKINKNYAAANYRAALVYLNNFKDDVNAENYALNYLALLPDDYSGYELLGKIYKTRAEKYIDKNTNTLLKEALSNYETALSKAVWGKDSEARKNILKEIEYIQKKLLE